MASWRLASCRGCQINLLDAGWDLLKAFPEIDYAMGAEAAQAQPHGRYDLSLVEGMVLDDREVARLEQIRECSKFLVSIGTCAAMGGIDTLRWLQRRGTVPMPPSEGDRSARWQEGSPVADYVFVDLEVRGCPVGKPQLIEAVAALLQGRRPRFASHSVCFSCKEAGVICLAVARGISCLGPVTHAGCGALCPRFGRGCYGCFGFKETPNLEALEKWLKRRQADISAAGNGAPPAGSSDVSSPVQV